MNNNDEERKKQDIIIMQKLVFDSFRLSKCKAKKEIYILTHAHTDHGTLPKTFPYPIYCSPETKQLLKSIYPKVNFVGSLQTSKWIFLKKKIFVYVFASEHCIGGIGIYCPQLSIMHFGEGRPKTLTMFAIGKIMVQIPPLNGPITTVCDSFFTKTDMPYINLHGRAVIPTLQESSNLLLQFILACDKKLKLSPERPLLISIAHFGVLSVLPRIFGYHFKIWSTKSDKAHGIVKPATLLCQKAFDMMHFQHGSSICVSRIQDVEQSDIYFEQQQQQQHKSDNTDNNDISTPSSSSSSSFSSFSPVPFVAIVSISSRWWLLQKNPPSLFEPTLDPKTGIVRIFACSHASSELNTGFLNLCKV